MGSFEIMEARHSVRQYTDKPLGEDVIKPSNRKSVRNWNA